MSEAKTSSFWMYIWESLTTHKILNSGRRDFGSIPFLFYFHVLNPFRKLPGPARPVHDALWRLIARISCNINNYIFNVLKSYIFFCWFTWSITVIIYAVINSSTHVFFCLISSDCFLSSVRSLQRPELIMYHVYAINAERFLQHLLSERLRLSA